MSGTSTWITQWECPQSDNRHLHPHNANFVQCNETRHNLTCNAAFLLKSGAFAPAPSPGALGTAQMVSGFGLGGIHRRAADDLAHLAGLLGQRAHLRLDIFAVQPHHFGQILGVQQLFGIVQRGLHVLFGVGYRLGADVLGASANGCTSLLERSGGLLCASQEFIKGLAGLLEARLGHRSHILWNLETVTPFIAHGATPFLRLQGHSAPPPGSSTFSPSMKVLASMTRCPSVS